MEAQSKNYKELIDKIDYNNYLLGVNSNLRRRQPRQFQVLKTQNRGITPGYTRIRNPLNNENNYHRVENPRIISQNNNFKREGPNSRFISNRQNRDENDLSAISASSNNTLFNNVMNKNNNINLRNNINDQNNYSINYTMRDSNYSNFSGSVFTTLTYNDLNSKYNYYKVLFHQLKGHNLALLNQIKKDKDLDGIIKNLEKENNRLKSENKKLKENNNYHANSDGEENIREVINKNYQKYFDKNNQKIDKKLDINYVLLQENNILKDEIKKLFKQQKKKSYLEDEKNNEIKIEKESHFNIINKENKINEKGNKNQEVNNNLIMDYINNLEKNKEDIKKFNKNELVSLVENMQNTNQDQKKELINLYNKLVGEDDKNNINSNINNKLN